MMVLGQITWSLSATKGRSQKDEVKYGHPFSLKVPKDVFTSSQSKDIERTQDDLFLVLLSKDGFTHLFSLDLIFILSDAQN